MAPEDPAIERPESAYAGTGTRGLSVRRRVLGNARYDVPARTGVSAGAKGSALAPPDGRGQFAPSGVQKDVLDRTALKSVSATTGGNVTLRPDNANVLKVSLVTGVTRSVLQALMARTVRVCVIALMAHAATTSTEPACASRASAVRTAGTGCVRPGNTACTASAPVSARTNTHSAATQ